MKTLSLFVALLLSSVAAAEDSAPISDLLGVRLGMSREEVRSGLADVARLERQERRRHEIWTMANDPRFAALIIGYTPEWNVRFVTAVAKPDGVAVCYENVLDLVEAKHVVAGRTHTYTWLTGTPAYSIIAIGGPSRLDYLSLEQDAAAVAESQSEEEDH